MNEGDGVPDRIGYLMMDVRWTHLSSFACEARRVDDESSSSVKGACLSVGRLLVSHAMVNGTKRYGTVYIILLTIHILRSTNVLARPPASPIKRIAARSKLYSGGEKRKKKRQETFLAGTVALSRPLLAPSREAGERMCIGILTRYACGHARMGFMNRHCRCALILWLVREAKAMCGRRKRECGGVGEVGCDVAIEGERRQSEGRRDGVVVVVGAEVDSKEKKEVM